MVYGAFFINTHTHTRETQRKYTQKSFYGGGSERVMREIFCLPAAAAVDDEREVSIHTLYQVVLKIF